MKTSTTAKRRPRPHDRTANDTNARRTERAGGHRPDATFACSKEIFVIMPPASSHRCRPSHRRPRSETLPYPQRALLLAHSSSNTSQDDLPRLELRPLDSVLEFPAVPNTYAHPTRKGASRPPEPQRKLRARTDSSLPVHPESRSSARPAQARRAPSLLLDFSLVSS